MGWAFAAVLSAAFLYIGGPQLGALLLERGPTTLSCGEFLERGASVRWVSLTDCAVDWTRGREFQTTRYRKAVYGPVRPSGRPSARQLFIRVEPGAAGRDRAVWQGMLDTPATDDVPDFARSGSAPQHILYLDRPSVWEMLLAVAPATAFVIALTRSVRRARVRAVDARRLRTRFPPRDTPGAAGGIDVTPVVSAARAALAAALLAGFSAALATMSVAVGFAIARTAAWTMAGVVGGVGIAAIVCWHRLRLDERLFAIGVAAVSGSVALAVPLCLAARDLRPAIVAVPLLGAAAWALSARRALLARLDDSLTAMLRAVPRLPRGGITYASAGRRPVRVTIYRASAAMVVFVGLMGIVVTGTGITLWIGLGIGVVLWSRGTRHALFDARTVMERDPRAPVLLLRSFGDDGLEPKGATPLPWASTETLAFIAATRLQALGPVIAVAPPGEKLPPIGPYRVFVQKDDWRAEVDRLIEDARVVVLFLGYSDGLLWEFRQLLGRQRAIDLIVVVPPAEPGSLEKRWDALIEVTQQHPAWSAVRDLDPQSTLLIRSLPDAPLLTFHGRQRRTSYDWAFKLCAASAHIGQGTVADTAPR